MSEINHSFPFLTPDKIFLYLDETDYDGYRATEEIFDSEILPYFKEYVQELEQQEGYADIREAFSIPGESGDEFLEPLDLSDFLLSLSDHYQADHPEWTSVSTDISGLFGSPEKYTKSISTNLADQSTVSNKRANLGESELSLIGEQLRRIPGLYEVQIDYGKMTVSAVIEEVGSTHANECSNDQTYILKAKIQKGSDGNYSLDLTQKGAPYRFFVKWSDDFILKSVTSYHQGEKLFERSYDTQGQVTHEKHFRWLIPGYVLDLESEPYQFRLYDRDGQSFGPYLKYEELPEEAFIDLIRSSLMTAEAYLDFEKAYLTEDHRDERKTSPFSENVILRIRQHGRRLLSIDKLEEKIEQEYAEYGLEIETENKLHGDGFAKWLGTKKDYIYDRIPVAELKEHLVNLRASLDRYPKPFLSYVGLKNIHLFTNIYDPKEDKWLGGFADYGVMTFNGNPITFDHELYHCADFVDGLHNDDHEWGIMAHGTDYELAFIRQDGNSRPTGYPSSYGFTGNMDHESERNNPRKFFTEDQPEVAERLLNEYDKIMKDAKGDPVLATKVRLMKRFYYVHSDGMMDEKYWHDLGQGVNINSNYWGKREANQNIKSVFYGLDEYMRNEDGEEDKRSIELEKKAERLLNWGKKSLAFETYAELAWTYPENPYYHQRLGETYNRYGIDLFGAICHYENAIRQGTRESEVFANLTYLYRLKDFGRKKLAIRQYRKLVDEGVRNPILYEELGRLYIETDQPEKAILLYKLKIDLCRVDGKMDQAYLYYFARFLKQSGDTIPEDQRRMAFTYIETNLRFTEPVTAFYGTIDIFLELQRIGPVLQILEKAMKEHATDSYLKQRVEDIKVSVCPMVGFSMFPTL